MTEATNIDYGLAINLSNQFEENTLIQPKRDVNPSQRSSSVIISEVHPVRRCSVRVSSTPQFNLDLKMQHRTGLHIFSKTFLELYARSLDVIASAEPPFMVYLHCSYDDVRKRLSDKR